MKCVQQQRTWKILNLHSSVEINRQWMFKHKYRTKYFKLYSVYCQIIFNWKIFKRKIMISWGFCVLKQMFHTHIKTFSKHFRHSLYFIEKSVKHFKYWKYENQFSAVTKHIKIYPHTQPFIFQSFLRDFLVKYKLQRCVAFISHTTW